MLLVLLLIPLYALADRFAGGGWPALDDRLPGRAAFWGALVCAGVGFLVAGLFGALCGLGWLIYRTIPWKAFGGSLAPVGGREIAGTFVRHLVAVVILVAPAIWTDKPILIAAGAGVAFAIVATLLAVWLSEAVEYHADRREPLAGENTVLELARGAFFGLAVAGISLLGS